MTIFFFSRKHSKKSLALVTLLFFATFFTLITVFNTVVLANMVSNPGFESGVTSWQFNPRSGSSSHTTTTATKNSGNASLQVTVNTAGSNPQDIELAQYGKSITAGQTYTVQFWGRASTTRAMDVVIQNSNSPFTEFMRRTAQLTTNWQFYSYTFVASQTQSNVLIGLQFGEATGTYNVDDVVFVSGTVAPSPTPTPPPGSTTDGTLYRAINFNGSALNVDGVNFVSESDAGVTFPTSVLRFTNTSTPLNPAVSANKTTMIRSSVWRGDTIQLNVEVPVPNNTYNVYVYSWEDTGATTYNLGFEGQIVASQVNSGNAGVWKRLGPYKVTVNDGRLSLYQTGGDFNLSGLEIYTPNAVPTATPMPPSAYKSITYRSSNVANNGAGSTSLTLTKPAGTVAGDIMVAQIVSGGASGATFGTPVGWTLIRRDNTTSTSASGIYYKLAGTIEPANYTWTINSSQPAAGVIATYYNVDTASPISAHSGRFNDDNPAMTANSITAATSVDRLLFFGAVSVGTTVSPPTGMATRNTASGQRTAYLSDRLLAVAGPTGNQVGQHAAGAVANLAALVSLRPAIQSASGPIAGSVANLNFFVSNFNPWIQATCGDVRMDNGIDNFVPAGRQMITTNASCTGPGIAFSGDSPATFSPGTASTTNRVVGGFSYPEVYLPPNSGSIFSSYDNLSAKSKTTDTPPINLNTLCTLSDCTLPANLAQGVYIATGNVVFNAYTFPAGRNYVFLVDGNITFRGNMITPVTSTSIFSASGNIIVPATLGVAPAATTPVLTGIFSADDSFIMQTTNTCADLRLNIEGVLIVNAAQSGGTFQNDRDMCGNNLTNPTLQITQRLDFVVNMPEFMRIQSVVSNEVAP